MTFVVFKIPNTMSNFRELIQQIRGLQSVIDWIVNVPQRLMC